MEIKEWDIYSYYDENDVLLYIGISNDTLKRQKQHMRNKNNVWKDLFTKQLREKFIGTRHELELREKQRILTEKPIYNVVHKKNTKPFNKPFNKPKFKKVNELSRFYLNDRCESFYQKIMEMFYLEDHEVVLDCSREIAHEIYNKLYYFVEYYSDARISLIVKYAESTDQYIFGIEFKD